MSNIDVAKKALTHLIKRWEEQQGGVDPLTPFDHEPWFECLADNAVFIVTCPPETPIVGNPEGEWRGKRAIRKVFNEDSYSDLAGKRSVAMIDHLEITRPLEFIDDSENNRVIVLYAERTTVNGIKIGNPGYACMVLEFRDGKIIRYLQIQDHSEYYTSGAWALPKKKGASR